MSKEGTYHPVFCVSGAIFSSIFCSSDPRRVSWRPNYASSGGADGDNAPMSLMFHTPGAAIDDILGFFVSLASLLASMPSTPSTAESTLESASVMLGGVV